jgi:hypothetical protein
VVDVDVVVDMVIVGEGGVDDGGGVPVIDHVCVDLMSFLFREVVPPMLCEYKKIRKGNTKGRGNSNARIRFLSASFFIGVSSELTHNNALEKNENRRSLAGLEEWRGKTTTMQNT